VVQSYGVITFASKYRRICLGKKAEGL
jgi:hypothetical protein